MEHLAYDIAKPLVTMVKRIAPYTTQARRRPVISPRLCTLVRPIERAHGHSTRMFAANINAPMAAAIAQNVLILPTPPIAQLSNSS